MKFGIVFPQTEFGNDPFAIRDYARLAEELGYSHIIAYEHVLGADPDREPRLVGPYTHEDAFHDPFVLFSFMAAVTTKLAFATAILILPQRQTPLVAKQAATLDVLSGGRFRLGIGLGWNWVEYQALGHNFRTRGRRVEEQVALLRRLWTEPLVTFSGRWDAIPNAGLNPLPVQQPIPIWFGGHAEQVLRRIAEAGDGWFPGYRTAADAQPSLDKIRAMAREAGRDPAEIGLEPRLKYGDGDASEWRKAVREWDGIGATHLSINTMAHGFRTPNEHMQAIRQFASEMGVGES